MMFTGFLLSIGFLACLSLTVSVLLRQSTCFICLAKTTKVTINVVTNAIVYLSGHVQEKLLNSVFRFFHDIENYRR